MKHQIPSLLRRLDARLVEQINFAQRPEDEQPSALARLGKAGLAVGGALAVGAGASYLRGRLALRGTGVAPKPGFGGAVDVAKFGVQKFTQDASGAVDAAKGAVSAVGNYFKKKKPVIAAPTV